MVKIENTVYSVDESGNVFNTSRGSTKPLSTWEGNVGYKKVKLRINKIPKDFYIHRLVAKAFIPNPDNLPQVMHIDNDKMNCHVDNLRWGTNAENTSDGYRDNLYEFKERSHIVETVDKTTGKSILHKSIRALSEELGYNRKTVTAILKKHKDNNYQHDFYYKMPND